MTYSGVDIYYCSFPFSLFLEHIRHATVFPVLSTMASYSASSSVLINAIDWLLLVCLQCRMSMLKNRFNWTACAVLLLQKGCAES